MSSDALSNDGYHPRWGTSSASFRAALWISQAIAFNVFLAFFPTLLLRVAWLPLGSAAVPRSSNAIRDLPISFLPQASQGIVAISSPAVARRLEIRPAWLGRSSTDWRLASDEALDGRLHLILWDEERSGFLHRQLRGLLLLLNYGAPVLHRRNLGRLRPSLRHW